jgi:phytoene/squalene synthetase
MTAFYTTLSPQARSMPGTAGLAMAITRSASRQTYYTILLLVDRDLVADAYRAYAYFRWLDDMLDGETGSKTENTALVKRQRSILEQCYRGETPEGIGIEEQMLVDLVRNDHEKNSGLRSYIYNMMAVMAFDVERRGRTISQAELTAYTRSLATAVTDALHYFIGHCCTSPDGVTRYLAVSGAHIVHMLRDGLEDAAAGYFNVPLEYIEAEGASPLEPGSLAHQKWVRRRVALARDCFKEGRSYIRQVKNFRCRLAGFAYTARFEWMLRAIERDGYLWRGDYPERKSLAAGLWMAWMTLSGVLMLPDLGSRLAGCG